MINCHFLSKIEVLQTFLPTYFVEGQIEKKKQGMLQDFEVSMEMPNTFTHRTLIYVWYQN